MARQNTYQTLCHITHVLGLAYNPEDKELEANLLQIPAVTLLLKKGNAEKKQKAMKLLDKHFPFMTPMLEQYVKLQQGKSTRGKETTPEDYHAILNMILPLINLLRNKYTHYKIEDPKLDASGKIADPGILDNCHILARLLNFCFDGARRIVKERFGTGENAPLKDKDFNFLTEEGTRYYKEDKKFIERKDFKYRIFDDTQKISNIGIFMLTCLLLEKKYASEFADQTDFFGKNLEPKRKPTENEILIMREAVSVYRIRLPKDRMQSDRGESALGLDMLNELKNARANFLTLSALPTRKPSVWRQTTTKTGKCSYCVRTTVFPPWHCNTSTTSSSLHTSVSRFSWAITAINSMRKNGLTNPKSRRTKTGPTSASASCKRN